MVIAHNMMAMNAQRQFNIVSTAKKKSTEKLSSGYRINRAADDAAGLAISEKMRRQIRGLTQGANNTVDGISLLQVADGALAEVHDILQRINELSIKSSNGTNTDDDRDAIQSEVEHLVSEVNKISKTTEFNELKLFCPQNIEELDSFEMLTKDIYSMLLNRKYPPATKNITLADGQIIDKDSANEILTFMNSFANVNEIVKIGKYDGTNGSSTDKYFAPLVENALEFSKYVTNKTNYENTITNAGASAHALLASAGLPSDFNNIYNDFYRAQYSDGDKRDSKAWWASAVLTCVSCAEKPASSFTSDMTSGVERVFRGINFILEGAGIRSSAAITTMPTSATNKKTMDGSYVDNILDLYKSIFINSDFSNDDKKDPLRDGIWIQSGAEVGHGMFIKIDEMNINALGISNVDVSTFDGAQSAIDSVKGALRYVSKIRSDIGAQQNRLEHTYKNVTNVAENTQAAESRIRDTDMAKEMVDLSKQNILEQVGHSMIAQANQSNQGVLSLLH